MTRDEAEARLERLYKEAWDFLQQADRNLNEIETIQKPIARKSNDS